MDGAEARVAAALHERLVDSLVERELIRSPRVEAAFRAVRREIFLPELGVEDVYGDKAIITKRDESGRPVSSSSQPAIMAIMLEQLDLERGHRVLEIGAGTGYNAALMAHIVGDEGAVTTVDIDADLATTARAQLAAAGFEGVTVICGDGMRGYPQNAPYDRIILTVAGWDIAPEWAAQLRPEGRLVLPLSFFGPQLSIAFDRRDGGFCSRSIFACGFMPVRGPRSEPARKMEVGGRWEFYLRPVSEPGVRAREADGVDAAQVAGWLGAPYVEERTGIEVEGGEVLFKWALWAALHEADHVLVDRLGASEDGERDPLPRWPLNMGVLRGSGLALLAPPPESERDEVDRAAGQAFPLFIRSYGPDRGVGEHLLRRLEAWHEAGRPGSEGASVWAWPVDEEAEGVEADVTFARRWYRYGVRWR